MIEIKGYSKSHALILLSLFCLIQAAAGAGSSPAAPNDTLFGQQWALSNTGGPNQTVMIDKDDFHTILQQGLPGQDIGWLDAQDEISKLAINPVTVAVIDSGIDASHPDLAGRVASGGMDFLNNFPFVTDPYGHGTHVSGIIAATSGNGLGIAGVAPPSVKILPLRTYWAGNDPKGNGFSYVDPKVAPIPNPSDPMHPTYTYKLVTNFDADAVNYAVKQGVSIINMSDVWPKIADTDNIHNAIEAAVTPSATQPGVLLVAAAGNDHKDQPTYPCTYEGVLCVGAVTNTGQLALFSNYGGMVDILAPGDGILSTYPENVSSQFSGITGYEILSGTSQSAPYVSGIAAVLKSIYPNISLNELKARLLASAGPLPAPGVALYGLVNLKRAIDAQPQPVYLPDFKSIAAIPIDESTLTVKGQISVENLWLASSGVNVQVSINGKPAGSAEVDQLGSGESIHVPWSYHFGSLDESSDLRITVQVSDDQGTSKSFQMNTSALRAANAIPGSQAFTPPNVKSMLAPCGPKLNPLDWMCVTNGHIFPAGFDAVESYPPESGLPRYYKELGYGAAGATIQIYDPSNAANPISYVNIPGIQRVREVVRLDVKGDGRMDWVVIGLGVNPGERFYHFEFYFLDPSLQPLFGTIQASNYQSYVAYNNNTGDVLLGSANLSRSYAQANSWMRVGGMLMPVIMASGSLPAKDDFPEQDARNGQVAQHLYYLAPQPASSPTHSGSPAPAPAGVLFELRALDNAAFRTKYPNANLENFIPSLSADAKSGHLRVLFSNGSSLEAPSMIWDIRSDSDNSVSPAPGWDRLSGLGSPYVTLGTDPTQESSAFLSFFDNQHGSISWVDPNGKLLDSSEFAYQNAEDPIVGLIGTFNIPSLGRFWFLQSGFDLVGYRQSSATGGAGIEMKTISLERETEFSGDIFSEMFTPVMAGTPANPLPGIYVDSTLVRGNQVAVAVWNPVSDQIEKPLRYSIEIPDGCMQMSPVQLTSDAESFSLPILCVQKGGQVQLLMVKPQ